VTAANRDLVAHFFRHEYGRLTAQLTRKVGVQHVELVEDAVQSSLAAALTVWVKDGVPRSPGAWLHRVACNQLVGELRKASTHARIRDGALHELAAMLERDADGSDDDAHFAGEVADDLLRMLFVGCDEDIPRESRLVFALRTLCGFSTAEIALRLFTSEANVHKRLQRARDRLREIAPALETPSLSTLRARLPSVHEVLYLLFNEGYLSAHADEAIRRELCDEAIRLTTILASHPTLASPETFALLALMHLHAARLSARVDASGGLLLLEEQDRGAWDQAQMRAGMEWLTRAASGASFSRYHAEAGIAAEHCMAPSFTQTRWREIARLYEILERIAPSPLFTLNRAIAVAEVDGPDAGLAMLRAVSPPAWLARSHLWDAALGDLHRRAGHVDAFRHHRSRALASAPTQAVRALLGRRLADT
jgi:RNA polymerase sigma-70 factor (ECF subfamily)